MAPEPRARHIHTVEPVTKETPQFIYSLRPLVKNYRGRVKTMVIDHKTILSQFFKYYV